MKVLTKKSQEKILENAIKLNDLLSRFEKSEFYNDMIEALDNISDECLTDRQLDVLTQHYFNY